MLRGAGELAQLAAYLPLAGGTLTGPLAGTTLRLNNAAISTDTLALIGTQRIVGTSAASSAFLRIIVTGTTAGTGSVVFDASAAGAGAGQRFAWQFQETETLGLETNGDLNMKSGGVLKLGNTRSAGVLVQGGSVTMKDSSGATITVLTT